MHAPEQSLYSVIARFIALWFLISIAACSGGSDDDSSAQNADPDSPPSAASATILADQGGTITLENGASVTIPPDALPGDTTITVTPVQVTSLGDEFVIGLRFEPDGLDLKLPAVCRFPLPSTWDGDEAPQVYEFSGNDPGNYCYTGKYAAVSGQKGSHVAETTVSHFSGAVLAKNCHTGTWQYMLESFRARGCTNENVIDSIRNHEDEAGKKPFENLALPDESTNYSLTEIDGSEKVIQAFAGTFFQEICSYNEGEDIADINKLLEYARDLENGRKVLLAFTDGDWEQRSDGFFNHYKHTASLELHNGQVKIRNSVSASDDIIQALKTKNGGNVFWYPKEGELTAEALRQFRDAKPFEALEDELCGAPGCLNDPAQNPYGIQLSATLEQRTKMKPPWTAVKIYVEKTRISDSPCGSAAEEGVVDATIDIPGYYETRLIAEGEKTSAVLSQITDGDGHVALDNIPAIEGYSGSDPLHFEDRIIISLNPALGGPGTYTSVGNIFDLMDGVQVGVDFTTAEIRDQDAIAGQVIFSATSGTVVVEHFGLNIGDRISGTFDVDMQGEQNLCSGDDCDDTRVITGTIAGSFDGVLVSGQNAP
ncbi:MAG: hypothetical protein ACOZF0_18040 [Thermodesulfobacteriota bacterium]